MSIQHGYDVFIDSINKDKKKQIIYEDALSKGEITYFDQVILSRLRKMYYGFIDGLIYMLYEATTYDNIADRADFLSFVLEDFEYEYVIGNVDSIKDVHNLDSNGWYEIKCGNAIYVYDLFSMLKIEKNIYYKLENPIVLRRVSKKEIVNHPGRYNEFDSYHNGFDFMLIPYLKKMEKDLKNHPFQEILSSELDRFKHEIDFEKIVLDYHNETYKKGS